MRMTLTVLVYLAGVVAMVLLAIKLTRRRPLDDPRSAAALMNRDRPENELARKRLEELRNRTAR